MATEKMEGTTAKEPLLQEPLVVTMSRFSDGVKMVFLGVMTILESISPRQASTLVGPILNREEDADNANETGDAGGTAVEPAGGSSPSDVVASADTPDQTSAEVKEQEQTSEEPASSVTLDDITKVIMAKIKQKRSNNDLIAKILATYKAARVSELKPSQYESFLMDLSQL